MDGNARCQIIAPISAIETESFRMVASRKNAWRPAWRACLAESDFPMHYTAPEYFQETIFFGRNPFAVLGTLRGHLRAILTGVHHFDRIQSGMANRPQIAFSRYADRSLAMDDLIAGLLQEAGSASVIDLFLWSDMAGLVGFRFRQRASKGVVILDLSVGPDALFRSLFLRKFGGEIVPTTRHRMDLSLFRQHTIMDWMADKVEDIHPLVPPRILGLSRSLRTNINKLRSHNDRGSA
jgi:hypothetical protein